MYKIEMSFPLLEWEFIGTDLPEPDQTNLGWNQAKNYS